MRSSSVAAVALSVCLAASLVAQTPAKRSLSVDDIYRMQEVGHAQTSPDGKWIAYTVTSIDREADKRVSSAWMVNWGRHTGRSAIRKYPETGFAEVSEAVSGSLSATGHN